MRSIYYPPSPRPFFRRKQDWARRRIGVLKWPAVSFLESIDGRLWCSLRVLLGSICLGERGSRSCLCGGGLARLRARVPLLKVSSLLPAPSLSQTTDLFPSPGRTADCSVRRFRRSYIFSSLTTPSDETLCLPSPHSLRCCSKSANDDPPIRQPETDVALVQSRSLISLLDPFLELKRALVARMTMWSVLRDLAVRWSVTKMVVSVRGFA